MATKSRHLKTAMQLWVGDRRKAGKTGDGSQPYSSADLARWTGVSVDTARGWESRGRPSEDAIAELERRFGAPAPRDEGAVGSQDALVIALTAQTKAIEDLVRLLTPLLGDTANGVASRLDVLDDRVKRLSRRAIGAPSTPRVRRKTAGSQDAQT